MPLVFLNAKNKLIKINRWKSMFKYIIKIRFSRWLAKFWRSSKDHVLLLFLRVQSKVITKKVISFCSNVFKLLDFQNYLISKLLDFQNYLIFKIYTSYYDYYFFCPSIFFWIWKFKHKSNYITFKYNFVYNYETIIFLTMIISRAEYLRKLQQLRKYS